MGVGGGVGGGVRACVRSPRSLPCLSTGLISDPTELKSVLFEDPLGLSVQPPVHHLSDGRLRHIAIIFKTENNFCEFHLSNTRSLFIRTSKFWPSLVVLKFLHNLSLNCS